MWKHILFATLSYFVITMATAYPWHVVLFHETYVSLGAITREEMIVPLGMLAVVIQGFVFAVIFARWRRGGHPVLEGIQFNLFAGLLVYTAQGLATAAKMDINPIAVFLTYHTIFQTIQFVATGAALGAIFGRVPAVSAGHTGE